MIFKRILSMVLMTILIFSLFTLSFFTGSAKTDYEAYAKKLDKTVYSGQLGAIYSKTSTTFRVWSPNAKSVKVRLYKEGSDSEKSSGYFKMVTMYKSKSTGVWSAKINGNLKNTYYTYLVNHGKKSYETADIYAKACGINGKRSMVVDLDSTDPESWEQDRHVTVDNPTDAKIWEIQIADFSSSETSGVSKNNRGKYLAFTETGTTVNSISGSKSTCVDYLKELGVNYVQINPFYDFGSVDEADTSDNDKNYNWGYDPVNYNCPEGSYSSNPKKGAVRIKECKQMIQALHKAGIGVIMDVVYNHTLKDKTSYFNMTVPNYYYRINSDGSWSNGSGCGNDVATERKMASKFIVDSVTYWAEEYHIDGFRFDLMGLIDVDTMNSVRASLDKLPEGTKLLMYGEPWVMSTTTDKDVVLANANNMDKLSDRIGAFDDTYRDALKGSTSGTDKGFIQSGKNKPNLRTGIAGQSDSVIGWAKSPNQCVTYGSCHDNLTMWDKLVKSVKGDNADYNTRYRDLVAMNKLAGAITLTSQGTSFLLAGEEFCRTKQGDENSYKSGFKVNQIDWNFVETYGDISDYYKGLIEIRNNISAFRDSTPATANSIKYLEDCPMNVLAYEISDYKFGRVFVAFNGGDSEETLNIQGDWVQLADENTAGITSLGNVGGKLKLPPHSAAILVDRENYNNLNITSDTGKVIVRYFSGDDIIKSYAINGKIGENYEISYLPSVLMNYDITKTTGKSGKFGNTVKYCDITCKPFSGDQSSITFQFLDGEKGTAVADFTVMTNRQGQKYQTMNIPSVEGYALDMERLPKNGCGEFTEKDKKVKYYYNKINPKDKTYRVNIIYMSTTGEIIGTDTLNGELNTEYSTTQIEFENYEYLSVTDNYDGVFAPTEQNVLYIYEPVSIIPKIILIVSIFALLIIVIIAILVVNKRKKERLIKNLEFV